MFSTRVASRTLERLATQLGNPSPRWRRAAAALALEAETLLRSLHLRQPQEAMGVLEALFRAFLVGKGVSPNEDTPSFYPVMGGLFTLLVEEVRGKHETHYPYLAGVLAAILAQRGSRGRRRPSSRR
ncbi:MAG: hypothetical protein NZ951_04705 [Dehalococcoidia bacterium]|nr:hypothetical protein [Dehalococcoidia bacterium]MDW8120316.1 hypothetical protein [Chloroflexota bacterium]